MITTSYIDLCIHCEQINADGQPVFYRTDNSCCLKCGQNEWILINADEELKDLNVK